MMLMHQPHTVMRSTGITPQRTFILALVTIGVSSIVTQIIFLREFLSVFFGNELVIGIILGCWMMLTATGAFFGKYSSRSKHRDTLLIILVVAVAVLPVATLFLLDYFRNIVFPVGTMIGLTQTLWSSLIFLLPFCIVSGFAFTIAASMFSETSSGNTIARAYAWESVGSVIGGIVCTIITVYFLTLYQSLIVLAAFNIVVAWILSHHRRILQSLIGCVGGAGIVGLLLLNLGQLSRQYLFPGQEILYWKDTPYGGLTLTQQAEQKNIYENGTLEFSTDDITMNEETVHYAMVQHPAPKNVLLISGGISGTLQEIVKYGVNRIDYVEINPWIIGIGHHFTHTLENDVVHIIADDARRYVRTTDKRYDVVLLNVSDPNTAQINRYYTREFFRDIKKITTPCAVVSFGVLSGVEYYGNKARQVNSVLFNTLKTEFSHVRIIPGMKNYFLGSDAPLHIDITRLIDTKKIQTAYVNRYYLDDEMIKQRSKQLEHEILPAAELNEDFKPITYLCQAEYWMSQLESSGWIFIGLGSVVVIVLLLKLNTINAGMFTAGFSSSTIEVVLLISFQIVYGYVYAAIGIVIACFMAGLAVGAYYRQWLFPSVRVTHYAVVQFGVAFLAVLLPSIVMLAMHWRDNSAVVQLIFYIVAFIVAMFVGIEFSMASVLRKGKLSSVLPELYGIDLIGSAIGAVVTSAFLIPLAGVLNACLFVAALNIMSGSFAVARRKSFA